MALLSLPLVGSGNGRAISVRGCRSFVDWSAPLRSSLTRRRGKLGHARAGLAGSGGAALTVTWCTWFSYHVATTQVSRGHSSWVWGPFSALLVAFDIQPSSASLGCMRGVRAPAILLGGGVSDRPRPFRFWKPGPPPAPEPQRLAPEEGV